MKTKLKKLLLIAIVGLVAGSLNGFAQIKTSGYKKISAADAGAVAAAEFAAKTQGEKDDAQIALQTVKTAESQTVAGTNYKFCIEVNRIAQSEEGEEAEEIKQFIQTMVFRNLKKEHELKSWQKTESGGGEDE